MGFGTGLGDERSEHTWSCTPDKLNDTIERVARNKHKVIRVVKGVEVDFEQRLILKDDVVTHTKEKRHELEPISRKDSKERRREETNLDSSN